MVKLTRKDPESDVITTVRIPAPTSALVDWYKEERKLGSRNAAINDILIRYFGRTDMLTSPAMQAIIETKIAAIDPSETISALTSGDTDEVIADALLSDVRAAIIETIHNLRATADI